MKYKLTKNKKVFKLNKYGINLNVYPGIDNCGIVIIETRDGHHQEFYQTKSTFTYLILEGKGTFFLDDKQIKVSKGDFLSIFPLTRIYYKGKMKMVLISSPAWKQKQEVETRKKVW